MPAVMLTVPLLLLLLLLPAWHQRAMWLLPPLRTACRRCALLHSVQALGARSAPHSVQTLSLKNTYVTGLGGTYTACRRCNARWQSAHTDRRGRRTALHCSKQHAHPQSQSTHHSRQQ
jgi:hypothetical protein